LLQLLDAIEDDVKAGGCIIDWHACDLFPKSWIDLVVVLRVDSSTHYDRLAARYVPFIMTVFQPFGCGFKHGI
jgi:adenylate kinase